MFYTIFRSASSEGLCCKPKYPSNWLKYILVVLAILFFATYTFAFDLCIFHLEVRLPRKA